MTITDLETTYQNGTTIVKSIIQVEGEIAGIAKLTVNADQCILSELIVHQEHRGRGYSKELQKHRENLIKNRFGMNEAYLFCNKNGTLRHQYEKRGYQYYNDFDSSLDRFDGLEMIWMVKFLN